MTIARTPHTGSFEWDETKNATNVAKHGISFQAASRVFGRPRLRFEDNRRDYGERRFRVIAVLEGEEIAVIYTERGETLRIISARRARRDERREYRQVFLE